MKPPAYLFLAGWRVFFWAAGCWAVAAMAVWLWVFWAQARGGDGWIAGTAMAPQLWHAHEMIFGYAGAALGGFFLTAVPNWTGAPPASGRFVAAIFALWLAGRLAVWLSGLLPAPLVAVVDLAFLPVLAARITPQLLARPKPQNMVFLLFMALLWTANLLVHLDWMGLAATEWRGLRGGLLMICTMIAMLGGRITPAFTRNALLRDGLPPPDAARPRWLDPAGIVAAVAVPVLVLVAAPDALTGAVAVLAGALAGWRLAGWGGWRARHQPIVWALHLGYLMLAFGLGSETGAIHVLGIGAIGGMTLAVMSRASLGHSGRDLVAPGLVSCGYVALPVAAAIRWAASAWPAGFHDAGVILSGLIWVAGFAAYLLALWPVFFGPRADGRPEPA